MDLGGQARWIVENDKGVSRKSFHFLPFHGFFSSASLFQSPLFPGKNGDIGPYLFSLIKIFFTLYSPVDNAGSRAVAWQYVKLLTHGNRT
jgi:hypothetical protein